MLNQDFQVIYEDNHLLVANKPANLLSQGDHTGDVCLLDLAKAYIKEKYQKPGNVFLELVHRLDRPTSGILCMARTSKALERLQEQFRKRTVENFISPWWSLLPTGIKLIWSITTGKTGILTGYLFGISPSIRMR